MIITGIEAIPLRIPFKAGNKSDASAWGDSNLPAADSLLIKVTPQYDQLTSERHGDCWVDPSRTLSAPL